MGEVYSREDLLALERDRWATLMHLVNEVPESRRHETSLTPEGWSVRDLVWHLGCWNDVVTEQLQQMQAGTFDDRFDWQTEENNARFLTTGHAVTFAQALAALERSRVNVIRAMQGLDDVTPRALELFSETTYMHLDDHVPELRRLLGIDASS
jgi:hypothetical protein